MSSHNLSQDDTTVYVQWYECHVIPCQGLSWHFLSRDIIVMSNSVMRCHYSWCPGIWIMSCHNLSWGVMTVKSSDINVMSYPVMTCQDSLCPECHGIPCHELSLQFTTSDMSVMSRPDTSCHDSIHPVIWMSCHTVMSSHDSWHHFQGYRNVISYHELSWQISCSDMGVGSCDEMSCDISVISYMSCHDSFCSVIWVSSHTLSLVVMTVYIQWQVYMS